MKRLALLAPVALMAGIGLTGCHQDPDDVCAVFKPHTGDTTVYAQWDDGQTRYECGYHHPGSIVFITHAICAYPPEHYSPPDNVWTKQNDCTF